MSDSVVVDSSLAVQWVVEEPFTQEARQLLVDWDNQRVQRLAPVLFLSEINTPLLKLRRQGSITLEDARRARADLLLAVTVSAEDPALASRAFEIADALALRTAHDSLYVALAERDDCEFWTADKRFYNLAHARFPRVRWVGEVQPPQSASE